MNRELDEYVGQNEELKLIDSIKFFKHRSIKIKFIIISRKLFHFFEVLAKYHVLDNDTFYKLYYKIE